ncbi:DUF6538 domain-containing protein [Mesobacterium hydrothermale]|uniref:DUF6538 domain-containing protein n=1 Tax=Mesobacterium hydrothermale TaxID=3111907 RepID=UPI00338F7C42
MKPGQTWSVKVAIPVDVQHVFGKRAFNQPRQTSDKAIANAGAVPLVARFKDESAVVRRHFRPAIGSASAPILTAPVSCRQQGRYRCRPAVWNRRPGSASASAVGRPGRFLPPAPWAPPWQTRTAGVWF